MVVVGKKGGKGRKKTAFTGPSRHDWQQIQIYQSRYSSVEGRREKGGEKKKEKSCGKGRARKEPKKEGRKVLKSMQTRAKGGGDGGEAKWWEEEEEEWQGMRERGRWR